MIHGKQNQAYLYSVGLKPTFGLVPYSGAIGTGFCVDHLGPMARNVKDCALLLEVKRAYKAHVFGYSVRSNTYVTDNITCSYMHDAWFMNASCKYGCMRTRVYIEICMHVYKYLFTSILKLRLLSKCQCIFSCMYMYLYVCTFQHLCLYLTRW